MASANISCFEATRCITVVSIPHMSLQQIDSHFLPPQVGDMKEGYKTYKASGLTDRDLARHVAFVMVRP